MNPEVSSQGPAKPKYAKSYRRRHCVLASCPCEGCESCSGHKFPNDKTVRKQWIAAVRIERPDYGEQKWSTTDHKICSHHFTDDCFTVPPAVIKSLASSFKVNIRLKAGSVPTLNLKITKESEITPKRRSLAVIKRTNLETIASHELEAAKFAKERQLEQERTERSAPPTATVGETMGVAEGVFGPLEIPRVILVPVVPVVGLQSQGMPSTGQPGHILQCRPTKQEPVASAVKLETTPSQPVVSAVDKAKFIERVIAGNIRPINAPAHKNPMNLVKPPLRRKPSSLYHKCIICRYPSDVSGKVSFHDCSRNIGQKSRWISAMPKEVIDLHGMENLLMYEWSLCSEHFCDDDYHMTSLKMAEKTGMKPGCHKLKAGTIPTQNLLLPTDHEKDLHLRHPSCTTSPTDLLNAAPIVVKPEASVGYESSDQRCWEVSDNPPDNNIDAVLPGNIKCKTEDEDPPPYAEPITIEPLDSGRSNINTGSWLPTDMHPVCSQPVVPVALVSKCIVSSKHVKGSKQVKGSKHVKDPPLSAIGAETKHGSAVLAGRVEAGSPSLTKRSSIAASLQKKRPKSKGQSQANSNSVVIDCRELFPAESIYTETAEESPNAIEDDGSCSKSDTTTQAEVTTAKVTPSAAAATSDHPNMALIRPASMPYDESSAVLAMDVDDEDPHFTGSSNTQVYLSDITSNIHKQKKRKKGLVELDDIEQALFPPAKCENPPKKKKRNYKKRSKKVVKPKQDTIDECEAEAIPDVGGDAGSISPTEASEKLKSVIIDKEFDYETFFDTSSDDEDFKKKEADDSDWEPVVSIELNGKKVEIKDIDLNESDEESSTSDKEGVDEDMKKEKFDCDECDIQYDDFWQHLVAHKLKEHPKDLHLCHICNVSCCESSLSNHMEEVHKMKGFPDRKMDHLFCPSCTTIHLSTLSYIFHWEEVHEQCLLVCELCDFKAGHRFQMKTHMQNSHSLTNFQAYMKNVNVMEAKANRKRTLKKTYTYCFMCGLKCPSGRKLKEHHDEMHSDAYEEKIFQCCVCQKSSSTILTLTKHYHDVHVDSGIECKFCPRKNIKSMLQYKDHIERVHCKIKRDFCEKCNLIISAGHSGLRIHVDKVHNNVRNNLCDTCGRSFKSADALAIHNLIHTGEKPIACSHCDYRCRQKTSLNWHMKTAHPDEMPVQSAIRQGRPSRKASTKKNTNVKQSPVKKKSNPRVQKPTNTQRRSRRKSTLDTGGSSPVDQKNTQLTSDEADGVETGISQNLACPKIGGLGVIHPETVQEMKQESEPQSQANSNGVVIDGRELFPAESIHTETSEKSLEAIEDGGSYYSNETPQAEVTSVSAEGTNDLPKMALIRPAGMPYDKTSAVLAMDVEDEDPHFTGSANTQVYLSDITSNIHKQKKRKKGLIELDDIEQALFPPDKNENPPKKKKRNYKKQSKKVVQPKQNTIGECEAAAIPDVGGDAGSISPTEASAKLKSVIVDKEFDYETFFDTSSDDEDVRKKDPDDSDWEPVVSIELNGKKIKIKDMDLNESDESDDESSISDSEDSDEDINIDKEIKKEKFDCDECDIQYDDFWQHLVAHKLEEHPKDLHLCHICNVSCSESSLSNHMEEVHKMKGFPDRKMDHLFCPSCTNNIHLSSLSYIFHWEEVHEQCLLVCELCDFKAGHRFQMKTHMQNSHSLTDFQACLKNVTVTTTKADRKKRPKRPYLFCFICGLKCLSGRKLREHQEEIHADAYEQKVFQCCECKMVSSNRRKLYIHYHNVHVDTGIECKFCPRKRIPTMLKYRDHIERIHCKIKRDFCEKCNLIIAAGQSGLRKHVDKVHKDVRYNLCDTCGRGFKSADALNIHNLIHTGEKPIACSHCDYCCRQKTSLNWHMKTAHPDEMPAQSVKKRPGRPSRKASTKKNTNVSQRHSR